ncbi:hypothetical protein [Pelotomaculum propionicicum]|uniref:Uncharacterized protein n=1 Tax=Pelotomaculum propionicicum TaxID=258475 RepID=A0A4Y7RJF0_9FIRM|nr:hypothetical protein [Pelotomaculum propionicicum]NLI12978.1 hypothetical protein [Peptococcaceae bacterium]TEB08941.1 hypothetical protein Pmgp_03517 [Pelotomaculum propionicicum]
MANIHDYYRKNFLYESHRLMLPELRDKVSHTCSQCKYMFLIVGKTESRPGCAALIPQYAGLAKRVPGKLDVTEVLRLVGKEGLERVLAGFEPQRQACGMFHPASVKKDGF